MVRGMFAAVPDAGIAAPAFSPDAVLPEQAGLLIRMVPERTGHSIELQASTWQLLAGKWAAGCGLVVLAAGWMVDLRGQGCAVWCC